MLVSNKKSGKRSCQGTRMHVLIQQKKKKKKKKNARFKGWIFLVDYILMLVIGFSKLMLFIEKQAKLFFFISKI